MSKDISVIIPVYNGAQFIERCLQSVIRQDNTDTYTLEIITINDGSNDESLSLLYKYKEEYPDIIKVVDQVNIGAARTRNKGIQLATGRYVMLVDQDDTIDQDYCKTLLDAATRHNSEVVQSGFKLVNKNGNCVKKVLPTTSAFGKYLAIPAWAKLYRTDFLKAHNIVFFDNNIGEDSIFTVNVITHATRYNTIQYAGYCNSFDNSTNVTNTLHKGLSPSVQIIKLLNTLYDMSEKSDKDQRQIQQYNILRTALYYLLSYGKYASSDRFYTVYKELFDWLKRYMPNYYKNSYIWHKPRGEYQSVSVAIASFMVLHASKLVRPFAIIYCKRSKV